MITNISHCINVKASDDDLQWELSGAFTLIILNE